MRMPAVARIDDTPAEVTRGKPCCTGALMAQHDHLAAQRLKGANGIDQRLPLAY